ncbi:MFS transporter [Sphingosinicella sp. LHD-64]|uniref:MFS transporter n=1 Tax=Sphingosinicella sp. LHD-64 TaxID=3072139 RepID=UPI00280EE09D|nr:MFS transporter [Sphingosinicella sp. LHD-64]MDQ8758019.1 MFS transporter [Sphingosinicella sp. LHD-64]
MSGLGLSRGRFALLFSVMLVAAAGNTAMQSLLPSIGRVLGVADIWVALAFSLSAVLWVIAAPYWAHRADRRGRRALMRVGLYGFVSSMLICGGALAAGLAGYVGPVAAFVVFILGRSLYGAFGAASPPAVQAYIAARTDGEQRINALAALASSFGLGTIIGPAVAPLFIFPPLGLSAPLIVFAGIGAIVLALLVTRLPDDTPKNPARGPIVAYPSIGAPDAHAPTENGERTPLRWRDPRVWPWLMAGMIGGHGQAILLSVVGFLVIDRLSIAPDQAQQWIAIVLIVGAFATLLAQWWLIPQLALDPRQLILWGSLVTAAGTAVTGVAETLYGITLGYALGSLGFGLFRPGFTSGASLAVGRDEQNAVAGMVTSVNGIAYIAAPAVGVGLYMISLPLPFLATAALMIALAAWTGLSFRGSA